MKVHLVLKKYFDRKKRSGSGFSIRSLAKRIDVSPSFISRVLSGQKPLPYSLLVRLRTILDMEDEVFELLRDQYTKKERPFRSTDRIQIQSALGEWELAARPAFHILRQWFYLPILECTTLKNYDGSLKIISKRLGLSETVVGIAVREMTTLGIMKNINGQYFKAKKKLRWGSAQSVAEVRSFHHQMMSKAQDELREKTSEEDFSRRLITGITITASPEKVMKAKVQLSEALHKIANELVAENGSEVYQLSAQLFPLTK